MIEVAVGYLVAYLGTKAAGLVSRAAADTDAAFDAKLGELYDWVKAKVTGRPAASAALQMLEAHPDEEPAKTMMSAHLAEVVTDPVQLSELQALVDALTVLARDQPGGVAQAVGGTAIAGNVHMQAGDHSVVGGTIGDVHMGGPQNPS